MPKYFFKEFEEYFYYFLMKENWQKPILAEIVAKICCSTYFTLEGDKTSGLLL